MNEYSGMPFIWKPGMSNMSNMEEQMCQQFMQELDEFMQSDFMLRHIAFFDYLVREGRL